MSEWEPIHITIHNATLCKILEEGLSEEVKATHSVVGLLKYEDKWVIRLERDLRKPSSAGGSKG